MLKAYDPMIGTSAKYVMLSDRKNSSVCFDTIFGSAEPKITQHDTLEFLRLYRSTHFAQVPIACMNDAPTAHPIHQEN